MSSVASGDDVPMPIEPLLRMLKMELPDVEATLKSDGPPVVPRIDRSDDGFCVPMPIEPVDEMKMELVACATLPSEPTKKLPLASVLPSLLEKVVKSAPESRPSGLVAEAVGMLSVCVVPTELQPQPPAIDVVANVWIAPVSPLSEVMAADNPPLDKHVPLTAKQPPFFRSIPFA